MRSVFALLACTNAAWAGCETGQEAFMVCQIEDSPKELSVCFDAEAVRYRFGEPGRDAELALSVSIRAVDYTPWPGVGRSIWEEVTFSNDPYSYQVFAGFDRMQEGESDEDGVERHFGGVVVFKEDEEIARLDCDPKTVDFAWGEGLWDAKHAVGMTWDFVERQWIAPQD